MNVVIPANATHVIKLTPRYTSTSTVVLSLYNEEDRVSTIVANTFTYLNGIFTLTFDFTFAEDDKYQIKITDTNGVVYRGKVFATSQTPQDYKASNGLYTY